MIATLGGQPQVVTFALDSLLAQGESISDVFVLHLSLENSRMRQSLVRLGREFVDDMYGGRRCRLRHIPVVATGSPIFDIRSEAEAEATWQTVRNLLAELKDQGRRLHICVSGGRRMMGLLVMSAAAHLCDHQDRLWHMHTPDAFRQRASEGAVMHYLPEDGVQLIQVPLVPWGTYFPGLRAMAQAPREAVNSQINWLRSGDEIRCRQVLNQLTERQQSVLRMLAAGATPQEAAQRLLISVKTVDTHKSVILDACRTAWALGDDQRLSYHFVRDKFRWLVEQEQP
jgi:CRISPR-associated protein Csx14